jgi:hypothetical protein
MAALAILDLRHRWADGTTRLVFDPIELLERLVALTPRPRINLLLYGAFRATRHGRGDGPLGTHGRLDVPPMLQSRYLDESAAIPEGPLAARRQPITGQPASQSPTTVRSCSIGLAG